MKTLVYYTVGCSRGYIDMLALSIQSLRAVYSGDVGIICDTSFFDECKERFPGARLWTVPDSKTGSDASINKVRIFDFVEVDEYDSVLFLDTDILIMKSLAPYFEKMTDRDMLYVYTERDKQSDHELIYWSLQTYTEQDYAFLKENNILPFNAGTFGFVPSAPMHEHFRAVCHTIASHTGPYFYEQSFMNAHFNLRNKTDRNVFTPENYIFIPRYGRVFPEAILLHFAEAGQTAKIKCKRMQDYLDIWENYTSVYAREPPPVRIFETRDDMLSLVYSHGSYAEIGVFNAEFSDIICKKLQPLKLVLIDLFDGVSGSGDKDGNNYRSIDTSAVYNRLVAFSQRFPSLEVVKGDSSTELSKYPDDTFDMIYLDGDHTYQGVKKDLAVAYAKVRAGGWIMGHDYEINPAKAKNWYDFGVKQAVDEFCDKHNERISAKAMDGCVSFAIRLVKC